MKVGVSEEMLAIIDSYLSPKVRKNIEFIYDASVGNLENVKRYFNDSEISIESKIIALKRAVVGNTWEVENFLERKKHWMHMMRKLM